MKKIILLILLITSISLAQLGKEPIRVKQGGIYYTVAFFYKDSTRFYQPLYLSSNLFANKIYFPDGSVLERASHFKWGVNYGTSMVSTYDSLIFKEGTNITLTKVGNELTITAAGGGTGSGLNYDLSNLIATNINMDLKPASHSLTSLGTTSLPFKFLTISRGYGIGLMSETTTDGIWLRALSSPTANYIIYLPNNNGVIPVVATSPLAISNTGVISMTAASSFQNGYITYTNYNYWQAKVDSVIKAAATGTSLVKANLGNLNKIKTLTAGTGITLTDRDTTVLITGTSAGADVSLSNLTTTSINQPLNFSSRSTATIGSMGVPVTYLNISGGDVDPYEGTGIVFWRGSYPLTLTAPAITGTRQINLPNTSGTVAVAGTYPCSVSTAGYVSQDVFTIGESEEIGLGDSVLVSPTEYSGYSIVSATATLQGGFGGALGITVNINSPVGAPQTVVFKTISNQQLGCVFYYQLLYKKD
jgi:hypothetical protein